MQLKRGDRGMVVDYVDDPAPCPKCGKKTIKQNSPLRPMPTTPKNGEDVSDALGQVFCESCNETYPWEYRFAL